MWVISKSSRTPGKVSYTGPTWDRAGIREFRQDVYEDERTAQVLAERLTEYNPVGFIATEVE